MDDWDWLKLMNRRAAMREQFPSSAAVMRERPGSASDRDEQAIHAAQNRAATGRRSWVQRARDHRAAVADADRFIAEREKERARNARLSKPKPWARAHEDGRRTA